MIESIFLEGGWGIYSPNAIGGSPGSVKVISKYPAQML
jgi:hypothetical protein